MASHTAPASCRCLGGNHRWRWKVENVAGLSPELRSVRFRRRCPLLLGDERLRSSRTGYTSCVADGFKTLDYGEPEPGRTVGFIVGDQHDKVPAYLSLADWSLDFSATLDSAGNAWPVVQQKVQGQA